MMHRSAGSFARPWSSVRPARPDPSGRTRGRPTGVTAVECRAFVPGVPHAVVEPPATPEDTRPGSHARRRLRRSPGRRAGHDGHRRGRVRPDGADDRARALPRLPDRRQPDRRHRRRAPRRRTSVAGPPDRAGRGRRRACRGPRVLPPGPDPHRARPAATAGAVRRRAAWRIRPHHPQRHGREPADPPARVDPRLPRRPRGARRSRHRAGLRGGEARIRLPELPVRSLPRERRRVLRRHVDDLSLRPVQQPPFDCRVLRSTQPAYLDFSPRDTGRTTAGETRSVNPGRCRASPSPSPS